MPRPRGCEPCIRDRSQDVCGPCTHAPTIRVPVIEDDGKTAAGIVEDFTSAGFAVDREITGPGGLRRAQTDSFDVITLDRLLPGMDGLTLLDRLRASGVRTPVDLATLRRPRARPLRPRRASWTSTAGIGATGTQGHSCPLSRERLAGSPALAAVEGWGAVIASGAKQPSLHDRRSGSLRCARDDGYGYGHGHGHENGERTIAVQPGQSGKTTP